MTYVCDSSVAVEWVIPETDSDKAVLLRDEFQNSIHELIAPDVFPFELGHALTRAERQNRINTGEALTYWTDVMATSPRLLLGLGITERAIDISSSARVGFYDCLFVALAEQENCELIAADTKLVRIYKNNFRLLFYFRPCRDAVHIEHP